MKDKIQADIKDAMRARNQHLLVTLRQLMSEIKRVEVDTRADVDEAKILAIVQKEIKKRKEALKFAEDANRAELVEQNNIEIEMLSKYLGEQLSEQELRTMITALIASGAGNLGMIMGALNKDHKGKFDNKLASDIAKSQLG